VLTLELVDPAGVLSFRNLLPGSSVYISLGTGDGAPRRLYTPIAVSDHWFMIIVKRFARSAITHDLFDAVPGDTVVQVSWPHGRFEYTPCQYATLAIITSGSGITVVYRVIEALLADPADRTRVLLVYQNRSRPETLLHPELCQLAAAHRDRFGLVFVNKLSGRMSAQPAPNVRYIGGEVNEDILATAFQLAEQLRDALQADSPGSASSSEQEIDQPPASPPLVAPLYDPPPPPEEAPEANEEEEEGGQGVIPSRPPQGQLQEQPIQQQAPPEQPAPHGDAHAAAINTTAGSTDQPAGPAPASPEGAGTGTEASSARSDLDPKPRVWLVGPESFIQYIEECLDLLGTEVVHLRRVFAA